MTATSLFRPAIRNPAAICWLVVISFGISSLANQKVDYVPICQIQGNGFASPYAQQTIQTRGIVTLDLDQTSRRGFFLQDGACDGNATTSDGIFVYLGKNIDLVQPGEEVLATGLVQEYYGMTELIVDPADISFVSAGHALPDPIEISPPFSLQAAHLYLERLEGMRVSLDRAVAVGPTGNDGRSWIVQSDLGIQRVFADDPGGTGEILCIDQDGSYTISPEVKVGDQIAGVQGVVDYRLGIYCLQLSAPPQVTPAQRLPNPALASPADSALQHFPAVTLATFNLSNLFDTFDDPNTEDTVLNSSEFQRRLQKRAMLIHNILNEPALLAVQEVENSYVLQSLANRPEITDQYQYLWQDGPDRRGLDLALLYRPDLIQVLEYSFMQGCTSLVDGLDADGNGDMANPQNMLTCDTNGDGILEGNRLFSRLPLIAHLRLTPTPANASSMRQMGGAAELWIIVCHFKSKTEDTDLVAYTLPRRIEQAKFVKQMIDQINSSHPGESVIALGDFNDLPGSAPASIIETQAADLVRRAPHSERYTYIFQGVSQTLDHVFTHINPPAAVAEVYLPHVNADYPAALAQANESVHRSSDHDPVLIVLNLQSSFSYMPMIKYRRAGAFH